MPKADSSAPVYARATSIIGTDVDGEVVLLNPTSWNYFELDNIGASIWTLLETPRSLPALVEDLMAQFDVDRALCLREATAFLESLIDHGLVAVVEG